jgi:tetratricopeptide (TPR) repeat protein
MSGIGHKVVETWTVPVEGFAIGDEQIKNTRLMVGKLDLGDIDMILGADFFLSHRLYVARSQNKLYFSYNGGGVFRLDAPPRIEGGQPASSTGGADTPQNADTLGHEGLALMARHDYAGALKLFDKAVTLEPKTPNRYLERARAYEALGKRDLAMGDIEEALKLKPDDVAALIDRGAIEVAAGDLAHAEADFTAARKATHGDNHLDLFVAAIYERHHHWAEALTYYDAWIAQHAKDDQIWQALNDRCWARAMLGKDLDKALDDCNASIKRGPRNSPALDSRAMVYLRMGRLHEALDGFNAALGLQPKLAWALFGRGLTELKLGMQAKGDADIAAALALSPSLEATAKEIGLIEAKATAAKTEAKPKTDK